MRDATEFLVILVLVQEIGVTTVGKVLQSICNTIWTYGDNGHSEPDHFNHLPGYRGGFVRVAQAVVVTVKTSLVRLCEL